MDSSSPRDDSDRGLQAKCKRVRARRLLPGLGSPGRLPGRSGKFRSLKSDLQGVAWIVIKERSSGGQSGEADSAGGCILKCLVTKWG